MRRERGDDLLDHAVGEIFLLRVAAHVLERQHRDRRLVGQRQGGDGLSRRRFGLHPIHPDRLRDVLDLLIAEIVEGQRQLVADVVARCSRDADRAGLGESFQPGGDIDAVAEQIARRRP